MYAGVDNSKSLMMWLPIRSLLETCDLYVHECMNVCMYVCMYVWMYVYIYVRMKNILLLPIVSDVGPRHKIFLADQSNIEHLRHRKKKLFSTVHIHTYIHAYIHTYMHTYICPILSSELPGLEGSRGATVCMRVRAGACGCVRVRLGFGVLMAVIAQNCDQGGRRERVLAGGGWRRPDAAGGVRQ